MALGGLKTRECIYLEKDLIWTGRHVSTFLVRDSVLRQQKLRNACKCGWDMASSHWLQLELQIWVRKCTLCFGRVVRVQIELRTNCLGYSWFKTFAQEQETSWKKPRPRGFLFTHNDAPQSVGLLLTSDQLIAEISTWQHTTLTTNKHVWLRWDSNTQFR
jgi:hypothetical protein